MPTPRTQAERTAAAKAAAFLKRVRVDIRTRKEQDRLAELARASFDEAAYIARIGLAGKAQAILTRVGLALREGRLDANQLDRERLRAIVGEGLESWRADLWLQNAARTAYHAGRYEQQQRDPTRGYLLYRTMQDGGVRPGHARLDGVLLPKGHVFWATHYPPNGHNCRCRVDAKTRAEAEALARAGGVKTRPPRERQVSYVDSATGERMQTPETVDPGWAHLPNDPGRLAQLVERSIQRLERWRAPI